VDAAQVAVPDRELERACVQRLTGAGAADDIAVAVARALTLNERRGYPSHGLLRLRDHLTAIERGTLDPRARPAVHHHSAAVRTVDGRRGFGVLAAAEVAAQILHVLDTEPLAAVALVNSTHIGRPADIGEQVANAGRIVLGWINNPGAQERVLAWRGPPQAADEPYAGRHPPPPQPVRP
jgi:LDH2 family malate/lactate/ureidoglycolate dehydrogenase